LAPPLAPPPSPAKPESLSLTLVAAGSVADYDEAKVDTIKTKFAAAAGVDKSAVTISLSAGSVLIHISVHAPTMAKIVSQTLAPQMASPQDVSTLLNISVISRPLMTVEGQFVVLASPSPPPPLPPSPSPPWVALNGMASALSESGHGNAEASSSLAVPLAIGGALLAAVLAAVSYFMLRARHKRQEDSKTRRASTTKHSTPMSVVNLPPLVVPPGTELSSVQGKQRAWIMQLEKDEMDPPTI